MLLTAVGTAFPTAGTLVEGMVLVDVQDVINNDNTATDIKCPKTYFIGLLPLLMINYLLAKTGKLSFSHLLVALVTFCFLSILYFCLFHSIF